MNNKNRIPDSKLLILAEILIRDCEDVIKERGLESILDKWNYQMDIRCGRNVSYTKKAVIPRDHISIVELENLRDMAENKGDDEMKTKLDEVIHLLLIISREND